MNLIRRLIDNRWFWRAVIGVILIATVVPAAWRAWHGHSNDFAHYWNAALAMRNGQDIYTSGENRYVYPPLLAFLFQPFTFISQRAAAVIWISLSGIMTLAAVLIAAQQSVVRLRIDPAKQSMVAAIAMVLSFDKIRSLLSLGQSDAITLLGFAGAFCWMETNPWLAGLAVGASANVKYISLIFVPYFLIKRNWRATLSAAASFLFSLFLPAVQIGFQRTSDYAKAAFGGVINMFGGTLVERSANIIDIAWNRSVSIPSTIFRLTRSLGWSDFVSVCIIATLFAATLTVLVRFSLFCSGSRKLSESNSNQDRRSSAFAETLRRDKETAATILLEWTALIVLALVFSPQTTMRHMVLIVLAYVVAISLLLTTLDRKTKRALLWGIAVMVAGLTLPPYGIGINQAVWTWRAIGGASWCALVFLFVIVRTGTSHCSHGALSPCSEQKDAPTERGGYSR